jgi:cardiolipin synthase C
MSRVLRPLLLVALSSVLALALPGCGDEPGDGALFGLVPPVAGGASLSTPPTRPGNEVRLLINGEASFAERAAMIEQAQTSIYVQALIFHADDVGRALGEALIRRKLEKPALDIRVIVDAYSNIQDVGAQFLYFQMKNAGIEVEGFEVFYMHWINEIDLADWLAGNKRYHEKYWIIDGQRAVLGGMNIGDEYARCSTEPANRWRDQDVVLQGPVVADAQAAFLDNFAQFKAIKESKPGLVNPDAYWQIWNDANRGPIALLRKAGAVVTHRLPGVDRGPLDCPGEPVATVTHADVPVRYVRNRPREGERHIPELYLELIRRAKSSVLIENAYFVPRDDLVEALAAAAKRGVRVQLINNSLETNDIPLITTAGRLRYRELVAAGVEVYEWHGERYGEGCVHSKLATFDDAVAIVGSYNLDPRSEGLNSEDVVLIESAAVAKELATFVRESDLPKCDRIHLPEATQWANPDTVPGAPAKLPLWSDPRFDRKQFEYLLLGAVEGSL